MKITAASNRRPRKSGDHLEVPGTVPGVRSRFHPRAIVNDTVVDLRNERADRPAQTGRQQSDRRSGPDSRKALIAGVVISMSPSVSRRTQSSLRARCQAALFLDVDVRYLE